jgi:2',3'-cyclic-nucleotide 2'-phosphodiesterase (5'-nucleotidase family)
MASMSPIFILDTNDIHGCGDGLARITTLVAQVRAAHGGAPVFYFDFGVEGMGRQGR